MHTKDHDSRALLHSVVNTLGTTFDCEAIFLAVSSIPWIVLSRMAFDGVARRLGDCRRCGRGGFPEVIGYLGRAEGYEVHDVEVGCVGAEEARCWKPEALEVRWRAWRMSVSGTLSWREREC